MYAARDIARVIESIAPPSAGIAGDELGFIYGDAQQPVTGIACLWNVHRVSLQAAVARGLNFLLCHETLWLPPQQSPWYDGPAPEDVEVNHARWQLLDGHHLVVYRAHSNWDALPVDGVPDQAVATLGIIGLAVVQQQKFFAVHELPAPMTVAELHAQVQRGLGYGACRIFGDPQKAIRRFAFLIGGFGENQWHMAQSARDLGAEALIIGEMSEFFVVAALEMGLPVIETLHSVSEEPAMRRQAQMLSSRLPNLPVQYIPSGALAFSPPT